MQGASKRHSQGSPRLFSSPSGPMEDALLSPLHSVGQGNVKKVGT